MSELKSRCCGAELDSISSKEGTSYYRCSECKEGCDIQRISAPFIPPSQKYIRIGDRPLTEFGKLTNTEFKQKVLENPDVKEEYDALTTEEFYLDSLEGTPVNIYLTNGIKLSGSILSHDDKTILLHSIKSNNLIYKSAIASIEVENERD